MLTRIHEYLRAVAPVGRESEQIGPFLATFNRHNNNPFLNYAVPDVGAEPSPGDIDALVDAYRRRERRPRLEYIPAAAPEVEQRLVAAGFTPEGRLPVMVTDADALGAASRPAPEGLALRPPNTDDELYAMAVVQAEAYEDPQIPGRDVINRRRAALADGALAVIAVQQVTGEVVGAGSCSPIREGLTEVAAIGVAPRWRRRGIGQALASRLGLEAVSAGAATPWLMAAGDGERLIYERAGFRMIGYILHISR